MKINYIRFFYISSLVISLLVAAFMVKPSSEAVLISLNSNKKYQTIVGWEAVSESGETTCDGFDLYKSDLFSQAINDLGINRIRVEINSGAENPVDYFTQFMNGQITKDEDKAHRYEIINDDNSPNVINPNGFKFSRLDYKIEKVVLPLRDLATKRGEKLWINITYVDFSSSAFEHKEHSEEYGEFVLATYQHLKSKYGITPDSWEVILEPDTNAAWSGAQIGQAIVAAGNRIKGNGFVPYFIAPSTTNMGNADDYFNQANAVSGALPYIYEISYHRYSGVSNTNLQSIANLGAQYGKRTAMLEHIASGHEDLHQDLKVGNISAWEQYTLGYCNGDDGASYYWINNTNPQKPVVTIGSRTRFLRQYFKYIRNGAVRIEATSNNSIFDPLAFINKDGGYVVVVKSNSGGPIEITGLPAGGYGIKYTTNSSYNIDLKDVVLTNGQVLSTAIPESGVLTIYSKPNASKTVYCHMPFLGK